MTKPQFSSTREADDLVVMEVHGRLDATAMEVALDMLVREVDGMHHGGMLMRLQGVQWPTLAAIGVELRHWGQLMAMIEKIDRVAVLTDDAIIRGAVAVESVLIPNMVIKAFAPADEAAARAWLAQTPGA
jgi:hypothetical protein